LQVQRRLKRRKRLSPKNNGQSSLRVRALRLLARREHSRLELERKLATHAESPEELAKLLDDLAQRGWLSEQRVIEQVIQARRHRLGSLRIRQVLIDKGIDGELVAEVIVQLQEGEIEAATALWHRKFDNPPRNMSERARQIRFMQNRGFTLEVILHILKQVEHSE
jgi:regulatory protein